MIDIRDKVQIDESRKAIAHLERAGCETIELRACSRKAANGDF